MVLVSYSSVQIKSVHVDPKKNFKNEEKKKYLYYRDGDLGPDYPTVKSRSRHFWNDYFFTGLTLRGLCIFLAILNSKKWPFYVFCP